MANISTTVNINPHNQKLENVHRIVSSILGRAGCDHCGRVAVLRIDFVSDPGPDLAREGAISVRTEEV